MISKRAVVLGINLLVHAAWTLAFLAAAIAFNAAAGDPAEASLDVALLGGMGLLLVPAAVLLTAPMNLLTIALVWLIAERSSGRLRVIAILVGAATWAGFVLVSLVVAPSQAAGLLLLFGASIGALFGLIMRLPARQES